MSRQARPPRGGSRGGPRIPNGLLHECVRMDAVHEFRQELGGIAVPVDKAVSTFMGVVMPLNNEDLQRLPEGTSTTNSQKLYTNGAALTVGQRVRDGSDGQEYTVVTELTHGPVHNLKRYVVTKKGVAGQRG